MKLPVEVHKEGKYFVAVDLLTNVADQGSSEEEALQNIRKGLREHYHLLIELTPKDHILRSLENETDTLFFLISFVFKSRITERRGPGHSDERSAAAVREEREWAAGGKEPATIPRASSATGKGREAGPMCERSETREHRTPGGADEVKRRRTLRAVCRHPGEMMDIARTHFCFNRISSYGFQFGSFCSQSLIIYSVFRVTISFVCIFLPAIVIRYNPGLTLK
jgi:predicted RNase H-like HicB family nuclease